MISGTSTVLTVLNVPLITGTNIVLTSGGSIVPAVSGTDNIGALATPFNNVYVNNIFVSGSSIGQRLIANIQVVSGTTVAFSGLTTGQRYKAEYNLNWGSAGGPLNTIFNNDTGAFYNFSTFVFSNAGSASRTGGAVANIPLTDPSVNITTPGQANGNFTFQSQPGSGVNASIFGEATANTGAGASSCQGVVCNGTYFGTANITTSMAARTVRRQFYGTSFVICITIKGDFKCHYLKWIKKLFAKRIIKHMKVSLLLSQLLVMKKLWLYMMLIN